MKETTLISEMHLEFSCTVKFIISIHNDPHFMRHLGSCEDQSFYMCVRILCVLHVRCLARDRLLAVVGV